MGPDKKIPAAQYGFSLNQAVTPAQELAPGDYAIDLGNGTVYTLHGFKPRVIDALRGLAFLTLRFTLDGADKITGIDYKWRINDMTTGTFRDATKTELALLYKGASDKPGHIGCSTSGGGGENTSIECSVGIDATQGSVAASDCSKSFAAVQYDGAGGLSNCYISSRDVFGSQVAYKLNP
jgi:hypothetical protein